MRKRHIAEKIAKFFLWYNRGVGLTNIVMDIMQKFFYVGGSMAILDYLFKIKLTPELLKVIVPVWFFGCILIGYADYKVGFAKVQNDIQNKEYTPFFGEISEDVKEIKKVVEELKNKQ